MSGRVDGTRGTTPGTFAAEIGLPHSALPDLDDGSLETIAYTLARHGRFARVVTGGLPHLRSSEGPVLVELHRGVGLLRSTSAPSAELLLPDGTCASVEWSRFVEAWTGRYVSSQGAESARGIASIVISELGREAPTVRLLLIASALTSLANVAIPVATNQIIDYAIPRASEPLVWALAIAAASSLLLVAIAQFGQGRALRAVEAVLRVRLLNAMMAAILRAPVASATDGEGGDRAQRVASADIVASMVVDAASQYPMHVANVVGAAAALTTVNLTAALATIAVTVPFVVATVSLAPAARRATARELEASTAARQELLGTLFSGVWIKAMGLEQWKTIENVSRSTAERERVRARRELSQRAGAILSTVQDGGSAVLLLWCAAQVQGSAMSLGALVATTQLGYIVFAAVAGIGKSWFSFAQNGQHVAKVNACLASPSGVNRAPRPAPPAVRGDVAIEAKGLWFQYGPELPWVVADHGLRVHWGESVEIRGTSGSGKTTLLRLVAGLLQPIRGGISLAGRAPSPADDTLLYVPQNSRLFGGSIRENMFVISRGASRARLIQAAECTGLLDLLVTLPMGEDTRIAGGGAAFSAGQRQLIILTAALASAAPILLLDEAFAHFDPVRRNALRGLDLLRERTVVSVTHELATASASTTHCTLR